MLHHSGRGWAFALAGAGTVLGIVALTLAGAYAGRPQARQAAAPLPFSGHAPDLAADSAGGTISVGTPTPTAAVSGTSCGSGHEILLGFGDAGAAGIARDALPITVAGLRTLARPADVSAGGGRSAPFESTLYSVTASVVSMSQLSDGTIVLLIGSPGGGATVPVLLPPRNCIGSASAGDQGLMNGAATSLRLACGDAPAPGAPPQALTGTATITGTGLWSSLQVDGMPPNGAALGPALSFTWAGGSCDPTMVTPTPTPSPTPSVRVTYFGPINAPTNDLYAAGSTITARARIVPAEPGVSCSMTYRSPMYVPLNDPAFVTKLTDSAGTVTWTWVIPADSPRGAAAATAYCGGVPATVTIYIG